MPLKDHYLYNTHSSMIKRCHHPVNKDYVRYGAKGVAVCDRWRGRGGFKHFLEDVGERPKGTTLDRIDNEGNYEPGNVRWATPHEQSLNRKSNHRVLHNGKFQTLEEHITELGLKQSTVATRLKRGWKTEDIFKLPRVYRKKLS